MEALKYEVITTEYTMTTIVKYLKTCTWCLTAIIRWL